jgi:hypothetical protein
MAVPLIIGAAILAAGVIGSVASGALSKQNVPGLPTPAEGAFKDPGSAGYRAGLADRLAGIDSRGAPQAGGPWIMTAAQANAASMDPATRDMIMKQRALLSAQLMDQAQGKGPSLASMQYQQALDQSLQGQLAAAAAMRGKSNGALAMRNIQNQAGVECIAVSGPTETEKVLAIYI